jgi:DNA polymerase (family 10)
MATFAEVRGLWADAHALRLAADLVDPLAPRERRALLKQIVAGEPPPGVAPAIAEALRPLAQDDPAPDAPRGRMPQDIAALFHLLSMPAALALYRRGPSLTVADFRAYAARTDNVSSNVSIDPQELDALVTSLRANQPRLPLGRALSAADALLHALPPDVQLTPVGSLRRFEPTVGDITLIGVADEPKPLIEAVLALAPEHDIRHASERAVSIQFHREEIYVRILRPEEAGCGLIHYTGSRDHVLALQARAETRGLSLQPHALVRQGTMEVVPTATEADVYAALGLPLIPAELRHGLDELELADGDASAFASLVTVEDIRGDLHTHTLWSDGRDTGESIIRSCRKLGYEYVAITDHSPNARASRTLSLDRLQQQMAEVQQLRARFPDITILQGVEVDILADGGLDFPDEVLEQLDIVLASLHEHNGDSGTRLLERYIAAMRHPLVNVITHPANRTPGVSEGYDLDYDRLFAVAAETGTAVEVDGAPGHLDLDGHLARRAAAAGVTFTIDSDGHFAERLGRQMRMGVGTARRGAVATSQVLNARPLADVQAFVAAKRQRA